MEIPKYRFGVALVLLIAAAVVSAPGESQGGPLSFSIVAQPGDTIGGVTLNNLPSSIVSLNNNGDVAFDGSFGSGNGIFTLNSLVAARGDTIGGRRLLGVSFFPSLNDNGDVAFGAILEFDGSRIRRSGIFTQNALLAETGDTIGGKTLGPAFGLPSLNNNGDVAFFSDGGIFTQNALLAVAGDTIGGKTLTSVGVRPSLNNNGDVAFSGGFSGGVGIFTRNAFLAGNGDTIGGKTLGNIASSLPVLNDNGDVVFRGVFDVGGGRFTGTGIFTPNALLIGTGDTIDGKTLESVFFPSLNNNGDIAFLGVFTDGSRGIVVGHNLSASAVPEPSGFALLGIGCLGLFGYGRRRRKR